jgi:hypothetical protein
LQHAELTPNCRCCCHLTSLQTKSYILLLDTADCEHLVLEWVRVLLTCVK